MQDSLRLAKRHVFTAPILRKNDPPDPDLSMRMWFFAGRILHLQSGMAD